jgi:integrase
LRVAAALAPGWRQALAQHEEERQQDLRPAAAGRGEGARAIENGGEFYFWTGNGLRKSAVADWQRALRRIFELAKVKGHPHMFRHTFATDLLAKGIRIEDVSIPLGHKSIKITESYYSHWIKARRERLEESVRELWT